MTMLWMLLAAAGVQDAADRLRDHVFDLQKAIRAGDAKAALGMTRELFCDEARLRKALKDDVDKAFLAKLVEMHKSGAAGPDEKVAGLFKVKPEQTEVQVHEATVEQIARYEKDSVAFKEFPGGARDLAAAVLRPRTTFYEVELVEPGKDSGKKFHLFFWDGDRWAMLGPAWNLLKAQ